MKRAISGLLDMAPFRMAVGMACMGTGIPFRGTWIRTEGIASFAGPKLFTGRYERAEIDFIHAYMPRDLDALELGSSIGGTSCQIKKLIRNDRHVTCVEANPMLISVLRDNLDRNPGKASSRVVHAMIGASDGPAYFRPDESSLCSTAAEAEPGMVKVPMRSFRSIVDEYCDRDYSLISDIEGAEGHLLGDLKALERCRCIILEAHPFVSQDHTFTLEDVIRIPFDSGMWRMVDRYGAVAAFTRE